MIGSEGEEPPHFHPEFGRFMLEATPGRPWGIDFKDLLKVESNMRWRYYIYNRRLVALANKIL
jgi:glutamate--cysteine ligase catalytic subunit